MSIHGFGRSAIAALIVSCLFGAGCAINPATGKRQLMLVSESQEIALGRENDKTITAQMGLYDDDALQAYVQWLGRRLAARSERPGLEWTFRVVDDPVVNAFALPGGYIYITRGILAHMESEAELAAVIGHEIGHVTARHSASQISKAQLAQAGFNVGAILAPEQAARFGNLAQSGLGLAFLKFGRDDERQADDLGLRYMVAAGYDARQMADVFDMLDRVSASSGAGGTPGWMSTHPAPENRRERAEARIAALNYDFTQSSVGRQEFLQRIDGMAFGVDPRQGYFKDRLFLHPELGFRMEFPEGWKLQNLRQAVAGLSSEEDAVVQLTLSGERTPEAALEKFFARDGVTRTGPAMVSISGLRTAGDGFLLENEPGKLKGRVGFVEHEGRVFQLVGYAPEYRWSVYEAEVRRTMASFDRLTDRRALDVGAKRLQIVQVDRAMTLDEFASRHSASVPTKTLALINRIDEGDRLATGRSYKIVTGGELP